MKKNVVKDVASLVAFTAAVIAVKRFADRKDPGHKRRDKACRTVRNVYRRCKEDPYARAEDPDYYLSGGRGA